MPIYTGTCRYTLVHADIHWYICTDLCTQAYIPVHWYIWLIDFLFMIDLLPALHVQCTRDVVGQLVPDAGIAHLVSSPFLYGIWPASLGTVPCSFSINVLGSFTCLGMTLPIHRTNSFYVVSEPREIHSLPMLRARFLHLTNFTALVEVRTTNRCTAGQRVWLIYFGTRIIKFKMDGVISWAYIFFYQI